MSGYKKYKPEFITELLKVDQVIGESATQSTLVNEITLPGKVRSINDVDASIRTEQTNVLEDKVIVEGVVSKQIYFIDEKTNELREETIPQEPFTVFIDVPGASPGDDVQVYPRIEFVGHDRLRLEKEDSGYYKGSDTSEEEDNEATETESVDGEDKSRHHYQYTTIFRQTVIFEVFVKVTESIQQEVVVDVKNVDPKKVIKELIKVESVVGEDAIQTSVENDIVFDGNVKKVRSAEARVVDVQTRIVADKVIVEGVIEKQILFVLEDGSVRERTIREPFTAFVDLPGAVPGMNVQVYPRVEDVAHDILEAGPDESIIRQTVVLDIFVKLSETLQIELVKDIKGIKVNKQLLKLAQVIGEGAKQASVVQTEQFPAPVRRIITPPDARVADLSTRIVDDKVLVEGVIEKNILFVEDDPTEEDGKVLKTQVREAFREFIDVPGARPGMNVQVFARVEFVGFDFEPGDEEVKETTVIEIFVKVTELVQQEVVVVKKVDVDPTVKVYVVKKGDTLSHIAKRFNTTVEAILQVNPEITDPNVISIGQKILIPKS